MWQLWHIHYLTRHGLCNVICCNRIGFNFLQKCFPCLKQCRWTGWSINSKNRNEINEKRTKTKLDYIRILNRKTCCRSITSVWHFSPILPPSPIPFKYLPLFSQFTVSFAKCRRKHLKWFAMMLIQLGQLLCEIRYYLPTSSIQWGSEQQRNARTHARIQWSSVCGR